MRIKKLFIVSILFLIISAFSIYLSSCGVTSSPSSSSEVIEKTELKEDMVYVPESYNWDGSTIDIESSIRINYRGINFVKGVDYELTYEYSTARFDGRVTVRMKTENPYLYGSVTKEFVILNRQSKIVYDMDEVKAELRNAEYKRIILASSENKHEFELLENEEITIPSNMTLEIRLDSLDEFYNYGTINIEGALTLGSGNYYPVFYNIGSLNATGDINFTKCRVFNSGTINSNKAVHNRADVYTNSNFNYENLGDTFNRGSVKLRQKINTSDIRLDISETDYTGEEKTVLVTDGTAVSKPFIIEYEDNLTPGTAKVNISIPLSDYNYYMDEDVTKTFKINKGTYLLTSEADLITARGTNYYDKYEIDSAFTFNNDLTIAEDETFTIKRNITKLTKNLENNGVLIAEGATINIDGNLVNNGEIRKGIIVSNGNLENNGTIDLNELRIDGNLVNNNSFNSNSFKISENNEITNTSSFSIGYSFNKNDLSNANITNSGTITNNSVLHYDNRNSTFINTKTFTNNSTIYTYNNLSNVGGTIIYKKNIGTDSVDVAIEYTNIDYDAAEHKPNVLIDNEALNATEFSKKYAYDSSTKTEFKDVGLINVTIKSTTLYSKYYGEKILTYNINRSVTNISNGYTLINRSGNLNYSGYKLASDITLTYSDYLTIDETQFLDLNGYSITLKNTSKIDNYGTIYSKALDNSTKEYSILLEDYSVIKNYNTIENNGVIYVTETSPRISMETDSSITGTGIIYTHTSSHIESLTNTIYERKNLENNVKLEYVTTTYNNTSKCPNVLTLDDAQLTSTDYDITYDTNPVKAGSYNVVIKPKDKNNHYFVGSDILSYEIVSSVKHITSDSDWNNNLFEINTYDKYVLDKNITATAQVTIPSDVIVDFGQYFITTTTSTRISASENTEIWVTVSNVTDLKKYLNNVTRITLGSSISNDSNGISLEFKEETGNNLLIQNVDNRFTLDLNGYNIESIVSIKSNESYDISIINSSSTRSYIRHNLSVYYSLQIMGLSVLGNDIFNFTIKDNITVQGVRITGTTNYGTLNFTAENVEIDNYQKDTSTGIAVGISGITNDSTNLNNYFNILFKDSTIRGKTGVSINNGGNVTFDNTTIIATAEADYLNTATGKAIYSYRNHSDLDEYLILVLRNGCKVTATRGYGIVFDVFQSYARETKNYSIKTNDTTFNTSKGDVRSTYY
ncbi:MAG: hypothetical protein IJR67_03590 [Acholeplasmatales bacterium]|nr:hypothetical protein [Acholeplasmatales bacterium]